MTAETRPPRLRSPSLAFFPRRIGQRFEPGRGGLLVSGGLRCIGITLSCGDCVADVLNDGEVDVSSCFAELLNLSIDLVTVLIERRSDELLSERLFQFNVGDEVAEILSEIEEQCDQPAG